VTVNVRDVVSPDVVLVTPAAGATGVDPNTAPSVRFSEPVDRSTITTATLRLTSGGTPVPSTVSFFDGDRTVALTPASALKLNTSYTIEATTAIADPAGNHLSSAIASSFKVQSPDTTAPRVSLLAPANGAVNVPVGSDIDYADEFTMSKAMEGRREI